MALPGGVRFYAGHAAGINSARVAKARAEAMFRQAELKRVARLPRVWGKTSIPAVSKGRAKLA